MEKAGFFARRKLKREARKIIDRIVLAYPRILALHPGAEDSLVNRYVYIEETSRRTLPDNLSDTVSLCCKTVNGLAYLLALEYSGVVRDPKHFDLLEFTRYLDDELVSLGFPPITLEQKEEIIIALELDVDSWHTWDESMK